MFPAYLYFSTRSLADLSCSHAGAVSAHQAIDLAPFLTTVVVHFLLCIALHCCSYLEPQKRPSATSPGLCSFQSSRLDCPLALLGSVPSVEEKRVWVGCAIINPIGQTFLGYCDLSMWI